VLGDWQLCLERRANEDIRIKGNFIGEVSLTNGGPWQESESLGGWKAAANTRQDKIHRGKTGSVPLPPASLGQRKKKPGLASSGFGKFAMPSGSRVTGEGGRREGVKVLQWADKSPRAKSKSQGRTR